MIPAGIFRAGRSCSKAGKLEVENRRHFHGILTGLRPRSPGINTASPSLAADGSEK